jgi:alanyl-tRNA synthetase
MQVDDLRELFLSYFEKKGHTRQPSSPLIPANDPTLLFTNAGMVQFKDVFLGKEARPYVRAVTSQRCVRAGGKHNDLENVGYTARHHTFFEMLGNFSFGDYFKKEAIAFAWEFLTKDLKLPPEKLWVTVYKEDKESEDIWLNDMKVDPTRFSRCGEASNFWAMGDTGPCGPCTEIFYDHGAEIAGGPPGSPDEDGDRYIEIWNLVFMQYNRTADGVLHPLPKPSVDTGMGLERIATVLQHVHNNYDIDLFQVIIKDAAALLNVKDLSDKSLRVIADHIRACSFLVIDGVRPSNEGRGYVLRRIIRRAVRHGHHLGATDPFFYKLVGSLVKAMGKAYPELARDKAVIEKVLKQEEDQFSRTLAQGMKLLEDALGSLKSNVIPGEVVFKLYDTYGFPVDLTQDIAREKGMTIDMAAFELEMQQQKERSSAASQFEADNRAMLKVEGHNEFTGYERLEDEGKITGIFVNGEAVQTLNAGEAGMLVLDKTSFYAASGGQVGDIGRIENASALFDVKDTVKQQKIHVHVGVLSKGTLKVGDRVKTLVDKKTRDAIVLNHSATHLLHAALREILGPHVVQKGSLVAADKLRFDFAHTEAMTRDEWVKVEQLVNTKVREDAPSHLEEMDMEAAMKSGAMALFGEKYDEKVRVLEMAGGFSKELCGGTHVSRAGEIGFFKLVSEAGIAAGVRRIEAITGQAALDFIASMESDVLNLSSLLKTSREGLSEKTQQLLEKNKELEREMRGLKQKLMAAQGDDALSQAVEIGDMRVLAMEISDCDSKGLRDAMDLWRQKIKKGVVVLAHIQDNKVNLIVGVTPDCSKQWPAGALVKYLAQQLDGQGGGRDDLAQGGGVADARLPLVLSSAVEWVRSRA